MRRFGGFPHKAQIRRVLHFFHFQPLLDFRSMAAHAKLILWAKGLAPSGNPLTARPARHAPWRNDMHIKQGTRELPLSVTVGELNRLRALVGRAGALARDKQRLNAEEARIKDDFERLRPGLERQHEVEGSYALVGEGGQIQVSQGEEFVLYSRFDHPDALRNQLLALDAAHLADLFRFEVKPDQRQVKARFDEALLSVGQIQPKKPVFSLRNA
jgi:hypothetical protein